MAVVLGSAARHASARSIRYQVPQAPVRVKSIHRHAKNLRAAVLRF
ncbi:hypothetical protein [Bradyrhizobium cenepequi]|nr:hypothetical protein [Bradyrhizobium cenepequi]MCA6105686.1 hypothetical protein [Bradyrhizobium cenepequi]